jgi:cellulase/cellobiase CelA1
MKVRMLLAAALAALLAGVLLPGGPAGADPSQPPLTCPPALPVSGVPSAVTTTSVTIRYTMFLTPPCGYDPPVTVTLFAGLDDAQQWTNPVASAVSGPERSGDLTLDGLTPGTEYWFRFSAGDRRDPYVFPSFRTAPLTACAATVHVDSEWTGGWVATVTVRNTGSEALDAWHVSWDWAGNERIQALWNAVEQSGTADVTIGNASYNGALPPGGATAFGLLVATSAAPVALTPSCTG